MKKNSYSFLPGFSLIEVTLAFLLILSISTFGAVAFSRFSDGRKVDNAAFEVATMLQKARSQALSQVKPSNATCTSSTPLRWYDVVLNSGSGVYQLSIRCGSNNALLETQQLPTGVSFGSGTTATFRFRVINFTSTSGQVVVTGFGRTRTLQVSTLGAVSIN